jgi:predicted RNA-binding protein with TRAM domain
VKAGEEIVVDVEDIHESGAGVGRTEDGFIVMVDGLLPPARARVKITKVHSNHARAEEVERLPDDPADAEDADAEDADTEDAGGDETDEAGDTEAEEDDSPRLGSRDNFWGS